MTDCRKLVLRFIECKGIPASIEYVIFAVKVATVQSLSAWQRVQSDGSVEVANLLPKMRVSMPETFVPPMKDLRIAVKDASAKRGSRTVGSATVSVVPEWSYRRILTEYR